MENWIALLLAGLALPQVGLSALFVIAFVSATLLPLGSEPALFGLVKLNPDLLWPAVLVATMGNTLGGVLSWWMGYGADRLYELWSGKPAQVRVLHWLVRWGPKACILSWLPLVGDSVCAATGWLRMPFWPCVVYMAVGKFGRYVTMTTALLWLFPGRFAL